MIIIYRHQIYIYIDRVGSNDTILTALTDNAG